MRREGQNNFRCPKVMINVRGIDGHGKLAYSREGARPVDAEGRCEQGGAF